MKKYFSKWLATVSMLAFIMLGLSVPVLAQTTAQQQINNGLCAGSNLNFTQDTAGQCSTTSTDATVQINNIVHDIINTLSIIVGFVAVVMIIFGGFRYVTSGGNDASVTSAKNTILYAIIGLVIVALSQIMVHFVLSKLTNS